MYSIPNLDYLDDSRKEVNRMLARLLNHDPTAVDFIHTHIREMERLMSASHASLVYLQGHVVLLREIAADEMADNIRNRERLDKAIVAWKAKT